LTESQPQEAIEVCSKFGDRGVGAGSIKIRQDLMRGGLGAVGWLDRAVESEGRRRSRAGHFPRKDRYSS